METDAHGPAVPRGRGAIRNPPNRFEHTRQEPDPDWDPSEEPSPRTQFLTDHSQSVISINDSPDIPFRFSLNPYRGCEHGCAYCYARPFHEYLGFSAGLDFETKIMVKQDAPELLRRELSARTWQPEPLALCGVTDPYQPVERRLQVTRRCLAVLADFRNPVSLVTKNRLIVRDIDLLAEVAQHKAVQAHLSVTTLDVDLARRLEPRTSSPTARLEAISALARAGVPIGVLVAPIIPGLTDHEIPAILNAAAAAGARWAGKEILRLPLAVAPLFEEWLAREEPLRQQKVLARIRSLRGGQLNDARFGTRMKGEGPEAERIHALFKSACRRAGLGLEAPELSTAAFRRPLAGQLELF